MGAYQKFKGNPEQKLFYLLNNFIGGINTEFSDDSSSDVDFESIINFDMDKLGTLNKRGGFGELTAISEIFNKLDIDTELPNIKNRTEYTPNPENENDNVVYMKLLRNDNNCFRALSAFSGENAYRKYQELYGFQNNEFDLLVLTTKFADNDDYVDTSTAWLYKCKLPELEYVDNEITDTETMTITCYKITLPVVFNWDRNLMNTETIEFYNKIYFTGNNKCIVSFDRYATVNSNSSFANAFSYSGLIVPHVKYICNGTETGSYYFIYNETNYQFTMPTIANGSVLMFDGTTLTLDGKIIITTTANTGTLLSMIDINNSAYIPSGLEVRNIGFNLLCSDVMHSIDTQGLTTDSIQAVYICTMDNIPLQNSIPLGQKFLLNIIYTGEDTGFTLEMKENDNDLSFSSLTNSTLSTTGLKVYEITFSDVPSKEVEIKITKTGATIQPYYTYCSVEAVDNEAKPASSLNVGDYGLCEMYNRAVLYKDDTIWFSEVNNFNYIPNSNYVSLPIEPTDKITKICYFKKSYIIFTKQRIYKMTGSFGTNEFAVSPVNTSLGCHAGNTVVPIEDTLYFASPRGLYALRSSQFVEGFENVKELDLKVKKLTSDFTKYSEELSNPAIRFNGINERAYALRYKDKYLLFYNNYGDKGDYAAVNGLDTLAYQFDIGAFTTYRFKEKPTFLFIVDNAIETFATAIQKEEYTEEEVLLNYNFNTASGTTIIDSSGNNNDATIQGNLILNGGLGLAFDGVDSNVKIDNFNGNIEDGITIEMSTKFETLNGATLLNLQQSNLYSKPINGSFQTGVSDGFYILLEYTITPNATTLNDSVAYKLFLYRTDATKIQNGNISYSINDGSELVSTTANYEFSVDEYSKIINSGNFTISRTSSGTYSKSWLLNSNLVINTLNTVTVIVLGDDVNLTNKFYSTSKSWIKLGFSSFKAVANPEGCTITYTPAVKTTASLSVGSRNLYVTIDGTKYTHTIPSISSSGGTYTGGSRMIQLSYSGEKNITVSMTYNIKATLGGTYTANVSTSSNQTIAVPSVTTNTTTEVVTTSTSISYTHNLNLEPSDASYREIDLKQNGDLDQLIFKLTSEYGDFILSTAENIGLLEKHLWGVSITKSNSYYVCNILKDNEIIKTGEINLDYVVNGARDLCYIGTDRNKTKFFNGDVYSLNIYNTSETLLNYDFKEGSGDVVYDTSDDKVQANLLGGVTWIVETGLRFDGDGYLKLPSFDDVYFTNGFKIEFQGILNGNNGVARILDLATEYNNNASNNKNCSINVGVNGNLLAFNSTGASFKSYRVSNTIIDLTQSHSFVINCVDNGKGYTISLSIDGIIRTQTMFDYGGIENIRRNSNFIGRSNTTTEALFKGLLNNFKITIYASNSPVPIYRSALYEFDTTPTDFNKSMYLEVKTKGVNMKYPQHLKKLKHIFVKEIGGYNYGELFFTLFGDGYIVNDPKVYNYYIDEAGTIVQDYEYVKNLTIDERISLLGNMRLDRTKLGEGTYQVRKLVIPKKCKNFTLLIYGESGDYISLESFGFVCKLGKVKEG